MTINVSDELAIKNLMYSIFQELPKDVQELITMWRRDPCWELEASEGYEQYHEKLKVYAGACSRLDEILRKRAKNAFLAEFAARKKLFGVENKTLIEQLLDGNLPYLRETFRVDNAIRLLMDMAQRIKELEDKVHELEVK